MKEILKWLFDLQKICLWNAAFVYFPAQRASLRTHSGPKKHRALAHFTRSVIRQQSRVRGKGKGEKQGEKE